MARNAGGGTDCGMILSSCWAEYSRKDEAMGILDDVRRFLGGKPITGGTRAGHRETGSAHREAGSAHPNPAAGEGGETQWNSSATAPPTYGGAAETPPAVQVLSQGPLTDLKRLAKYLAAAGVESHLLMPPGGCGT